MPDLAFAVFDAAPVKHAAAPLLEFRVRVTNATPEPIQTVALRCQIQIEARRRRYSAAEQESMRDLFGTPDRWSSTLKSTLWTFTSAIVTPFEGCTVVSLPVPCTFDFSVAVTKYFHGLEDGEVPLSLLFSGTVFYEAEDGALQVAQISWEKEATFSLPVRVWKEMMDHYYPGVAWMCLRQDAFDRLYQYKVRHGLTSFEAALERLFGESSVEAANE